MIHMVLWYSFLQQGSWISLPLNVDQTQWLIYEHSKAEVMVHDFQDKVTRRRAAAYFLCLGSLTRENLTLVTWEHTSCPLWRGLLAIDVVKCYMDKVWKYATWSSIWDKAIKRKSTKSRMAFSQKERRHQDQGRTQRKFQREQRCSFYLLNMS